MDDDKLITRMGTAVMMLVAGLYVLQGVQRLITPVEAEEEAPFGSPWLLPVGLIINVDYGEDEEPFYIGEAKPGTRNDEAAWRIYRYNYEMVAGDLEMVGLRFAEGTTTFDKVWDNRTDYEYS